MLKLESCRSSPISNYATRNQTSAWAGSSAAEESRLAGSGTMGQSESDSASVQGQPLAQSESDLDSKRRRQKRA